MISTPAPSVSSTALIAFEKKERPAIVKAKVEQTNQLQNQILVNRYFVYCRKSSEEEDRQVMSIQSQIQELNIHAQRDRLQIVAILEEAKSAKAPGRPVFN